MTLRGDDAIPAPPGAVEGIARNAKGRAVLEASDGRVLTVLGLDQWPDGIDGRVVRVTGRFGRARVLPVARQLADGGWTQGVPAGSGAERVVHDATWELVEPAP